MPFGKKKEKGFNLDCVLGNVSITIVTCCGYVFQGTIEDEENTRSSYGYPSVFPTIGMDSDKDCDKPDDEGDDDKRECHKPVELDVKCDNEPKFICLRLRCVPGNICCNPASVTTSVVTTIFGSVTNPRLNLFQIDDIVLINVDDIVAIGPDHGCLTVATGS